jgi:uncharacterized protein (TIGR03083 family)
MQTGDLIDALAHEGSAFAEAAQRAGLDAAVPTCPEWTVRELVRHLGYVHRWATAYVHTGRSTVLTDEEEDRLIGPLPGDESLLGWFRAGHEALVEALRGAPAGLGSWSFLPAESPLQFWARRQAHETSIHRVDAQSALGDGTDLVASRFGADGIDELLMGFYGRRSRRLRADEPRSLLVRADDAPDAVWTIQIGPAGPVPTRGEAAAQCAVAGPAAELYLALWNRRDFTGLRVDGDRSVLELWRERATVRWT